jgi:carboxylesterase type B
MLPRSTFLVAFLLHVATVHSLSNATIAAGTVLGTSCNTSEATAFLSIPYAQPPIGDLRFAPPEPYNTKYPGGIYQATTPPPSCIQFGNVLIEPDASEDWSV